MQTNFWKLIKNWQHSNTFWLYKHRVRNAYFQSYSQNKFQFLIIWTLFFIFSDLGWFKRHSAVRAHPVVKITEGSAGTLNFKRTCGINTTEKTISLGEEHSETLPNGDIVRVRIQSMFLKHQPIHVSETSTNPCFWNINQSMFLNHQPIHTSE